MLKNKLLVFIGVLAGVVKADYGKNAFAPRNDAFISILYLFVK